MSKEMKAEK